MDDPHLPGYLNEFTFRFNRRRSRSRGLLFYRVLELAAGHDQQKRIWLAKEATESLAEPRHRSAHQTLNFSAVISRFSR